MVTGQPSHRAPSAPDGPLQMRYDATALEGYPIAPSKGAVADVFAWTGIVGACEKAGVREVARRSATRPIMRRGLRKPRKPRD